METTYESYMKEKVKFIRKHNKKSECSVFTSPMENNRYHKEYCWNDGHEWIEITELIEEKANVRVHGILITVPVKFWKTEFWSTENPKSKYLYER